MADEEVLLDIADHAFGLAPIESAGARLEAVVTRQGEDAWVEDHTAVLALHNRRSLVIDQHFGGDPAEHLEGLEGLEGPDRALVGVLRVLRRGSVKINWVFQTPWTNSASPCGLNGSNLL